MRHTYKTSQWVPHPLQTVFAFFADPKNLPPLMPRWQKPRVEQANLVPPPDAPPGYGWAAGAGSTMIISFRPFPLSPFRMKWRAVIVEFAWNDHFCDEQTKGPFAYWRHCHRVNHEQANGVDGTRIVDDLTYEFPFGLLSEPAHALLLRRQIKDIFRYRQQQLLKCLNLPPG